MAPLDSPAAQTSVDPQHPWLGLASFTEETQGYFYGREQEVAELARRVQRKTLTLLFGQSGLGKTSILRAGIVPRLRPMGYCPVYVRVDYSADSPAPSEQIKQAIFRATQRSGEWTQTGVAVEGESLWEFLHHRDDVLKDEAGKPLVPLLIFDQFEEIFTLAQADDAGRSRAAQFIEDLADLVENRPPKALEARMEADESAAEKFDFTRSDYRILIALREDYLAHLEALKSAMPSITQNRMRLARMTGEQALEAVMKPGGKLVSQEVAEAIVRFVAGGSELRNAEVEPSLLSLICRELNNARIAKGRAEISADLLAGSHETILAEFYERALADQPAALRHYIEDELLTESGYRESIAEESVRKAFTDMGAKPDALPTLVDRRLLRIEERLDVRRVELTHDVLCSVVRAGRDLRHEREARDAAERKLAEQRARELATRKALVRARQIAAVCAVLAIGAVASAIYGYESAKRAQRAEADAQQTRQLADSARGQAEKLIVYLLDDFYLELEPIGRLDIVAALAKRAVDYYADLPAALRTPETDRNRALALVRYGAALRNQSKLGEAKSALAAAVSTLARLRAQGDRSEETAIGLGLGLMSQARVASSEVRVPEELDLAQRAVDVLDPLMKAPSPSVAVRRAYGLAATFLGFSQMQANDSERAVKTLDQAREANRSIADLKLDDVPAAVAYAEASSWQAAALNNLGEFDRLHEIAADGLKVSEAVLAVQPGNMSARRAEALLADNLVSAESTLMHARKALEWAKRDVADWQAMTELDPTNQISWNNLVSARMQIAGVRFSLGDIDGALGELRSALTVAGRVRQAAILGVVLALASGYVAQFEADTGNEKAAAAAVAQNRRYTDLATAGQPAGSFGHAYLPEFLGQVGYPFGGLGIGYAALAVPFASGDFATVHAMAIGVAKRLEAITPPQAGAKESRDNALWVAWRMAAEASWWRRDFASAGNEIAKALEVRRQVPLRNIGDQRNQNILLTLEAWIAAGSGDSARAGRIIAPVLAFERSLYLRKDNEDLTQHIEYAQALYASALAAPAAKASPLAQAVRLIDSLPPAMRRLISVSRLRARITEAQGS